MTAAQRTVQIDVDCTFDQNETRARCGPTARPSSNHPLNATTTDPLTAQVADLHRMARDIQSA